MNNGTEGANSILVRRVWSNNFPNRWIVDNTDYKIKKHRVSWWTNSIHWRKVCYSSIGLKVNLISTLILENVIAKEESPFDYIDSLTGKLLTQNMDDKYNENNFYKIAQQNQNKLIYCLKESKKIMNWTGWPWLWSAILNSKHFCIVMRFIRFDVKVYRPTLVIFNFYLLCEDQLQTADKLLLTIRFQYCKL